MGAGAGRAFELELADGEDPMITPFVGERRC
jgi:hypothetical protein